MRNLVLFLTFLILVSCKKEKWEAEDPQCTLTESINTQHPKGQKLKNILNQYTSKGIPGIALAIRTQEGYWATGSGYSKIETRTPMLPCNLQYSQSVSKTYMAVAILKLYEEGKINLDEKITVYLPENIHTKIKDAEKITVRMLLNHTSGIPEYNSQPAYVTYLLQHPLHKFTTLDYLNYIEGKELQFEPGSKYRYTNTNYELLALMGDFITGDHAKYIREQIFQPLGLVNSYYHDHENYLNNSKLVNSYWDRYSNGAIENCSAMQKINVASMMGDDGMIASPLDYVKFLEALMNGQLLQTGTLQEMFVFKRAEGVDDSGYGLGIHYQMHGQNIEYGHTGGGIGSGCYLGYFPHNNTYFFLAINLGTSISSPLLTDNESMVDEVLNALAE